MANIKLTGWVVGFINSSGSLDSVNANSVTSDFTEVVAGTTYTIKTPSSFNLKRFAFYDESKSFISRDIKNSTSTAPENCKYVRITVGVLTDTSSSTLNNVYLSYTQESSGSDTDVINVTGVELDANLLTIKKGNTLNVNATISPSNATDKTVTWSKNNNNVNIEANGLNCAITGVTVGASQVTVTTNDTSLTSTCKVIVVNDTIGTTAEYVNKYNLPWLLNKRSNNMNQYKFKDKKYYSLGDSISANDSTYYGYQSHIVDQLGVVHTNYAQGGATIVSKISQYLALDFSDVALVTIGFGVNDARTSITMGELGLYSDTSFNNKTFIGAYRSLLNKIYTDNPECRVILLTPLQRKYVSSFGCDTPNSQGLKLIDYVDAIIKIGEMYATPVCDMYRESGLNQCNLDYYTVEGVHPTQLGYIRMANLLLHMIDKF